MEFSARSVAMLFGDRIVGLGAFCLRLLEGSCCHGSFSHLHRQSPFIMERHHLNSARGIVTDGIDDCSFVNSDGRARKRPAGRESHGMTATGLTNQSLIDVSQPRRKQSADLPAPLVLAASPAQAVPEAPVPEAAPGIPAGCRNRTTAARSRTPFRTDRRRDVSGPGEDSSRAQDPASRRKTTHRTHPAVPNSSPSRLAGDNPWPSTTPRSKRHVRRPLDADSVVRVVDFLPPRNRYRPHLRKD